MFPIAETELQRWAEFGQVAAGIGAIFAALGVFAVWRQVKLQADASHAELVTTLTDLMVSVSRCFVEYPEMRRYFHGNEAPDDKHCERAIAIAVTVADAMDHIAANLRRMEPAARNAWVSYMRDLYNSSVVLRIYLGEHWRWYGPALPLALGLAPLQS